MSQPSTELYHLTIREAAGLIESKQLSPVELTQALLDRIDAVDGDIKSYITLLRRRGAGASAGGGGGDPGRKLSRAASRHTHGAQGPLRHQRHFDHGAVEALRTPGADGGLDGHRPPERGGKQSCWGRWRCSSLPWAGRRRACSIRRCIPMGRNTLPGDPAAARRRRWRWGRPWGRWGPTPAAPYGGRHRPAALSGTNPPTGS